ncbi:hypothetical protein A2188_00025 [Candidatus Woesebacteria bacterium RIFOXYA1_FULL_43_9]|uniref:Uncharacterized protein n=1 Tax=Candidatus Woesebacteria bacterium RIFOXYA1_FULL_43_9 TaxID=1802534 RepID=A0A1F8CLC4_9BACT|nr:MAG: hypothetical protein A2188_00025 [Candidatus Woesebacteria bacterium RIFOXYA1_FULL_43_9]
MYNWSTNTKFLKQFPQKYLVWKLENLINFGLGKQKLNRDELSANLGKIQIDPDKKKFLRFLLS